MWENYIDEIVYKNVYEQIIINETDNNFNNSGSETGETSETSEISESKETSNSKEITYIGEKTDTSETRETSETSDTSEQILNDDIIEEIIYNVVEEQIYKNSIKKYKYEYNIFYDIYNKPELSKIIALLVYFASFLYSCIILYIIIMHYKF